ncbi:MAG TPA: Na+/H+ antiporter NhaA [Sphingomicrobium sp.]|nr:Na+/H+ antiporter NhaA [Sphingomicrobium sp.]
MRHEQPRSREARIAADNARRLAQERLAGILLIAAAMLALLCANTPLEAAYSRLLQFELGPAMPGYGVLDVDHWISEGLMAVFFLLIGLEVKREWFQGMLSNPAERRLPIIAAIGGMVVPALIYLAVVATDPAHVRGWAIPAATDIAFAIGVLAILGRHAPASIKLLLVTIAVVDDVGAVAIIALVYTPDLNVAALGAAIALTVLMMTLTIFGLRRLWPYLVGFAALWVLVLASGVHATVAGVLTAMAVPLGQGGKKSPLRSLEHRIHPWVMFGIIPLFGFSSAGVNLGGGFESIGHPVALGVLLGLFLGKQLGVFGAIYVAERAGLVERPEDTNWLQIWGAAVLCGIGFTMSLFIGALAFPGDPVAIEASKLGTLAGSLLAALLGYVILRFAPLVTATELHTDQAADLFAADFDDEDVSPEMLVREDHLHR